MPRSTRSPLFGYLVALAATAGAVALREALDPLLGERAFNPFLTAAVAVSFWFGGLGPAVLAAIGGYAGIHLLILYPDGPLIPRDAGSWIGVGAYLASCAILIAFGELATRSQRRLEVKQRELERESAERKLVEEALWSSREGEQERRLELEALMGSAPAGIWVAHDPECRTITGNPAAAAMLGMPITANLSKAAPEAERANEYEIYRDGRLAEPTELPMQTAARTGQAVSDQELEFRFRDGRPSVWAYGNAEPLRDHRGEVRGAIATFVDITARRHAEELQRETEARFRTLADQAPVLIWVLDLDGCAYANREYLQFVGRTLDEVRGMGWADSLHPDDAEAYIAAYQRAYAARESFEAPFRFRRFDGEYRWMKSSGLPRLTADGSLVGYVGCSFDITDVEEAIEALRESDRLKDEFLATLAHELRNPLAPLRNGLAILRLALDGGGPVELTLGVMERQLGHLIRLVGDLVDVSRISRGKIELRRQRIDLAAAVEDAAQVARPRIAEEGHQLEMSLPDEPVMVYGDPTRLAQVVANLLDNAAKYTEPAGHLRLAVERREDQAVVVVEDDGIGIDPAMLSKVFDMFTQAHPLDRSPGGLGIGLTLVRRLVELHGGTVEASSEGVGLGSRFVVRLPLADAAIEVVPAQDQVRLRAEPARCRILVVDDNEDAAASLAAMLRMMGHEIKTAGDGMAAIGEAAAFRPDLVLLDIGMPKMNGYEVCRQMRAQPWGTDLLIAALTGWGQDEDKRRAWEAGFDRHLTKPMDPAALDDLLHAVRRAPLPASSGG